MTRKTVVIFFAIVIVMLTLYSCGNVNTTDESKEDSDLSVVSTIISDVNNEVVEEASEDFHTIYDNLNDIVKEAEYIECYSEINTNGNGIIVKYDGNEFTIPNIELYRTKFENGRDRFYIAAPGSKTDEGIFLLLYYIEKDTNNGLDYSYRAFVTVYDKNKNLFIETATERIEEDKYNELIKNYKAEHVFGDDDLSKLLKASLNITGDLRRIREKIQSNG